VSAAQSRRAGIRSPRSFSTAISSPPAAIHRIAAINSGGIVSSEVRIARYVVPQIRQTAIHAAYARAWLVSGFGIWDSGLASNTATVPRSDAALADRANIGLLPCSGLGTRDLGFGIRDLRVGDSCLGIRASRDSRVSGFARLGIRASWDSRVLGFVDTARAALQRVRESQ